jgi:peptidoglycan/LPS O-acetylase OafA/YrhL
MPQRTIPTLDGWRAIAILLVMASHAAMGFYATEVDYYSRSPFLVGAFGVDIFFGLSGLLITLMLLDEARAAGGVRLKAFYIRRAFAFCHPLLHILRPSPSRVAS